MDLNVSFRRHSEADVFLEFRLGYGFDGSKFTGYCRETNKINHGLIYPNYGFPFAKGYKNGKWLY